MDHYVGIDLHADNNYIAIIDHDNCLNRQIMTVW